MKDFSKKVTFFPAPVLLTEHFKHKTLAMVNIRFFSVAVTDGQYGLGTFGSLQFSREI